MSQQSHALTASACSERILGYLCSNGLSDSRRRSQAFLGRGMATHTAVT